MRFRRRTEVMNDGSVGGALRDRVLTGSDDNARFVSFGASGTSTVNTGFELPMGPVSTSTRILSDSTKRSGAARESPMIAQPLVSTTRSRMFHPDRK